MKFTEDVLYKTHVGCSMEAPLAFLRYLDKQKIPTTLRQVIVPTLNDTEENIRNLALLAKKYSCIQKTELLPFRKICSVKYENMGIPFPFSSFPVPTAEEIKKWEDMFSSYRL